MRQPASYDDHADWYEEYICAPGAAWYMGVVDGLIRDLLGEGRGRCLDLCCGTGARADLIRDLGWTPRGADLSRGQLSYARHRLPVVLADAIALPFAASSFEAAVCVLAHTDMPDYAAALREVARVLRPGGRFVHVGLHPCFVGAFADRGDPNRIIIDQRYAERSRSFDSWTTAGVRSRVGAWHLPVAALLNGALDAGLRIERAVEAGPAVPDVFALLTIKPVQPKRPERADRDGAAPVEFGGG